MSYSLSLSVVREDSAVRMLTQVNDQEVMHAEEFQYDSGAAAKKVYELAYNTFKDLGYQLIDSESDAGAVGFQVAKSFEEAENVAVLKEYFKGLNEVFPDQFSHVLEEIDAVQI